MRINLRDIIDFLEIGVAVLDQLNRDGLDEIELSDVENLRVDPDRLKKLVEARREETRDDP